MRAFILFLGILTGLVNSSVSCTTFVLQDSTTNIFGRNYDYDLGSGFVVINKRGLKKQALLPGKQKAASWVAKYGSVTFNQVGIDAPMGGMNEKGLVIAQMALPETVYPQSSGKPLLNQLEWIQYQLDVSVTLDEVIEKSKKLNIVPVATPVHYFICDSAGNMGVIEFLNGKQIIRQGKDLTLPVCSNIPYDASKAALREYRGFGGRKEIPQQWGSVADIIAIAASKIKAFGNAVRKDPVEYGFDILRSVSSPRRTQWSVVYDIGKRKIYFSTLHNKNITIINLERLDFFCSADIRILDLQKERAGNDLTEQFTILEKDVYLKFKKNLLSWFKKI